MVIYNVTCNMPQPLVKEWLPWIREHIAVVLGTGLFMDARLTQVLVDEKDNTSTYSIQFKATSRETLDKYYTDHAPQLRRVTNEKWGERVLAFRTELDLIDEYRVHHNMN